MTLLLLLTACGVDWGFGGQDMGHYGTDQESTELMDEDDLAADTDGAAEVATELEVEDVSGVCEPPDAEPGALELTGGAGEVDVVHVGVEGACSSHFTVQAFDLGGAVEAYYTDVSYDMPVDCVCEWTISYRVTGLAAGDWTVWAGGESATVTVE